MGKCAYNIVHGSLMGFRNRADTMIRFCGSGLAWKSGMKKSEKKNEKHWFNLFITLMAMHNFIHKQHTFIIACTYSMTEKEQEEEKSYISVPAPYVPYIIEKLQKYITFWNLILAARAKNSDFCKSSGSKLFLAQCLTNNVFNLTRFLSLIRHNFINYQIHLMYSSYGSFL